MKRSRLSVKRRKEIEKGIAAYAQERKLLRRLLKRGPVMEMQFDEWFRDWRRQRIYRRQYTGDSYILGMSLVNGFGWWAEMLELLQYMICLGEVEASDEPGYVVYTWRAK